VPGVRDWQALSALLDLAVVPVAPHFQTMMPLDRLTGDTSSTLLDPSSVMPAAVVRKVTSMPVEPLVVQLTCETLPAPAVLKTLEMLAAMGTVPVEE
jgi:hypothetical protein